MTRVPVSRAVLASVARRLQTGGVRVVFVGGATIPLRVDLVAGAARVTDDIDCVVDAVSYAQYAALLDRLRALGFTDAPEEGVTCRMRLGDVLMDFMPRANLPLALIQLRLFPPMAVMITTFASAAVSPYRASASRFSSKSTK